MSTSAEQIPAASQSSPPPLFKPAILQAAFLLGIALVAAIVQARLRPAAPDAHEITFTEAVSRFGREKILWIDARPAAAFAAGHTPGAIWLAEEAWEEGLPKFIEAWTPGQPIVVYCASTQCGSSRSVARRLIREFNATQVNYLKGGWDTLRDQKP